MNSDESNSQSSAAHASTQPQRYPSNIPYSNVPFASMYHPSPHYYNQYPPSNFNFPPPPISAVRPQQPQSYMGYNQSVGYRPSFQHSSMSQPTAQFVNPHLVHQYQNGFYQQNQATHVYSQNYTNATNNGCAVSTKSMGTMSNSDRSKKPNQSKRRSRSRSRSRRYELSIFLNN